MEISVPPKEGQITVGSQVEAAFRLFDQLPFMVRSDIAKLIYLYMHDSEGYDRKKLGLFQPPADTRTTDRSTD